jgi:hypothetical protein
MRLRREEEVVGVLHARLNLFSVTICISSFIANASKISTTQLPSIFCTRLVAPVCGSSIACFISLHSSRCSSRLMMSMIYAHLMGSLRLDASLYLFQRCSHCNWPACSSCSFISCLHAFAPAKHSGNVSALGLLIPAFHATQNTLPPELFPFSCHMSYQVMGTWIYSWF